MARAFVSGDLKIEFESFVFEEAYRPQVSIIIPVFGQIRFTYHCLKALACHKSRFSFEVIVIDDSSPDETQDILACIQGLKYKRHSKNQGFIISCNNGAKVARGHFVLFLNNDTEVQPGWLDELVETFNILPNAGLVGSKLLYPDATLQEAGGIIWNDGSAWNYGRSKDPREPRFNYLRDVDYCSGASIMLRKSVFERLGGFDLEYCPAYAEDSDLAFRVRREGLRVLYQPLSEVVHFEGVTSGRDLSSGVKAYQVQNVRKLYKRWSNEMSTLGSPGHSPELLKDRNILGRVLLVDHTRSIAESSLDFLTDTALIRILQSLGFKVTLAPVGFSFCFDSSLRHLQRIGVEVLYAPYTISLQNHIENVGDIYDLVIFNNVASDIQSLALCSPLAKAKRILQKRVSGSNDEQALKELISLASWDAIVLSLENESLSLKHGATCKSNLGRAEAIRVELSDHRAWQQNQLSVKGALKALGVGRSSLAMREMAAQPEAAIYMPEVSDSGTELVRVVRDKETFLSFSRSQIWSAAADRERIISSQHGDQERYTLPGYCRLCEKKVDFAVDLNYGATKGPSGWMPNWRERLVCPSCGLNNRQRMIGHKVRSVVRASPTQTSSIYFMEQVTPIFKWFQKNFSNANCIGSEYLGLQVLPGEVVEKIRHEDVERLTFKDGTFDCIISNDVFEHVANPNRAISEAHRVLRSKGTIFVTVPFYLDRTASIRRANLTDGKIIHDLEPVFHGNPVSSEGSLVFTDFGWDLLESFRNAGFDDVKMTLYWSEIYGHLGPNQHYISAVKA